MVVVPTTYADTCQAGLPEDGRIHLFDGRTGEQFAEDDRRAHLHAETEPPCPRQDARPFDGPYCSSQQPLGGKAQFGGQRLGEMEVWALYAYGAANILQEMLTVKSDDVKGRAKVYEAIVKGDNLPEGGTPESFNVLVRELQGLGLEVIIE